MLSRRVPCRTPSLGFAGILFTPISQSGHISWNVAMRQQLDIYASVVLCKSLPGFPTRHNNVDFAIIRENTEGEYSGLEHQSYPGVVESLKVSTRAKVERICELQTSRDIWSKNKLRIIISQPVSKHAMHSHPQTHGSRDGTPV